MSGIIFYDYNPFNFTSVPFEDFTCRSVLWYNSELVITLLIIITLCQLIQTAFKIIKYFKSR